MEEFKTILTILRRRWRVFGLIFGATVLLGLIFLAVAPKLYEVEVQFLYRPSPLEIVGMGGAGIQGMLGSFIGVNADLETQIALMNSMDVWVEAAKELPEEDIRYLTRASPLTYPLRLLKRMVFPPSPGRPAVVKAAFRLRKRFLIEPVGATRVIRVVYQDSDRERAVRIVNAFVHAAHERSRSVQQRYYAQVLDQLKPQLEVYEDSLKQMMEGLASFQETTLVFSPEDQASALFTQLITLEGLRGEVEGNLAAVRAEMRASRAFRDTLLGERFSDVMRSIPAARPLWDSLLALEAMRVRLQSQGYADTTPRVQEIDRQIQALQRALMERLDMARSRGWWGHPGVVMDSLSSRDVALFLGKARLEAQDSITRHEIARIESALKALPARSLEYLNLTRWATYYRQVWTTLQSQVSQFALLAQSVVSPLHVVQHPIPPADPTSPKIPLVLVASVFLGLMVATGGVFVREMLEQRVLTVTDAETLLRVPPIATGDRADLAVLAGETLTFLLHEMDRGHRIVLFVPLGGISLLEELLEEVQKRSVEIGRTLGLIRFLPEEPVGDLRRLAEAFRPGGLLFRVGQNSLRVYESPALRTLIAQAKETGLLLVIPSPLQDPQGYALLGKVEGVVYGIPVETPVEEVKAVDEQIRLRGGTVLGFLFFPKNTS